MRLAPMSVAAMTAKTEPTAHQMSAGRRRLVSFGVGGGPGTVGCTVSAFVICLVVVGAAIAIVNRAVDQEQPATESAQRGRAPDAVDDAGAVDLSAGQRVRSGVVLAMLLVGL